MSLVKLCVSFCRVLIGISHSEEGEMGEEMGGYIIKKNNGDSNCFANNFKFLLKMDHSCNITSFFAEYTLLSPFCEVFKAITICWFFYFFCFLFLQTQIVMITILMAAATDPKTMPMMAPVDSPLPQVPTPLHQL